MHSIYDTLLFMLNPAVIVIYFKLFIVLTVIAAAGIILFRIIFQKTNKVLLLGGGMIAGPLFFTLLLSIFSYLLKGTVGIIFIFIIFLTSSLYLAHRNKIKPTLPRITRHNFLYLIICIAYPLLFFFYAANNIIGGDASTYWGLAASFAKGNYPTVLPWQPDFLTVYHSGTFLLHGSINALTSARVSLIHIFLSAYMLSAVFIFLVGIAREKTRTIISIVPAILGIILFSPVFLTSNFANFINSIKISTPKQTTINLSKYPEISHMKGQVGIGASSIEGLVYINFMLYGLAAFLFFMFALFSLKNQSNIKRYSILITLTILSASIDETFFLIQAPILLIDLIKTISKEKLYLDPKKLVLTLVVLGLLSGAQFFIIQNPIRDSLLTPSVQMPRFKLLSTNVPELGERVDFLQSVGTKPQDFNNTIWYTPDIRALLIILLIPSLFFRSKYSSVLIFSAGVSLIFALLFVNTYWPENAYRFTIRAYHLAALALGFLIVEMWTRKNKFTPIIIFLIILVLVPHIITAHAKLIHQVTRTGHDKIRTVNGQYDKLLTEISKKIKPNSRIIFVDEYPISDLGSTLNAEAVTQHGFFVPTAPATPKIVNFDAGVEWFDTVTTLDPESIKKLKVSYVFLKANTNERFSVKRNAQLIDNEYFKKIYTDTYGNLYQVTDKFKNSKDEEQTIQKMINKIPSDAQVHLPRLQFAAIRNGVILDLSQRTHLSGPPLGKGEGYFLFIEHIPKYKEMKPDEKVDDFDYLITDPQIKLDQITTRSVSIESQNNFITIWKKSSN
jgi:hypothetical protein